MHALFGSLFMSFCLEQVEVSFGAATQVGPISLNIESGSTTVLIGPSGCGKSTVLRLMVGLVSPTRGEVRWSDQPLLPTLAQTRLRVGYVIQDGGLFPHLNARDNVCIMARHLRWESRRIAERLEALRELTRFPESGLQRYPHQLSGGQRQRVGLMRALMLNPDVLLLDEPLGALDPMIRAELQDDLRRIFDEVGKTVVLVTHDLGEAAFFGHVVVLMREGVIVQQGTLQAMVESPTTEFVTQFINAQRAMADMLYPVTHHPVVAAPRSVTETAVPKRSS